MGDSLPRPDSDDRCDHPYRHVEERAVTAYVEGAEQDGTSKTQFELVPSATVMFCTNCEKIVEVQSNGLDDLEYSRTKD